MNTESKTETEPIVNPNAETIQGLRELADFLESRPGLPKIDWAYARSGLYKGMATHEPGDVARMLGNCKKEAVSNNFTLKRDFPGVVELWFLWERDTVCKKVVTVVEKETYEYPEGFVRPEMVKVVKPIEVVTWECPESILAEAK